MRKIYSALDIGSCFIKLVVGEFLNGKLNILCAVKKECKGFRNNGVTDSEKLILSINEALNEASSLLNFKITKLIVNIPTDYNDFKISESMVPINSEEGIVTSNDILKVLQMASNDQIKETEELLATIPVNFMVGDNETLNPLGKKGKKLSLKCILVSTDKKRVYDIVKVLEKCDVHIVDITTTGLVDYYNFKNREFDNKNVVVINIGHTTTNISVFSKGIYINNSSLDLGGELLERKIASTYNLRKKDSVYLKENLALASSKNADIKEIVSVIDKEGKELKINQVEISNLVNQELEEMLKNIKKNINYLTKKEISYIIITGGLAELNGIAPLINKIFGSSSQIGLINDIGARDASYSASIGMLKYFNEKLSIRGKDFSMVDDGELENMLDNNSSKLSINGETILGKVFSYFFDN